MPNDMLTFISLIISSHLHDCFLMFPFMIFLGTRYKRRGVDTDGHVANYVESEQILLYHHYALSHLQVSF